MPRDGSNIYHQPFPNVVTDTEIESAVYNGFTNDVASDLNLPRPISAGGTGASDAATAITNLGGEVAKQSVTNYDSFPFKNGSFMSLAGATSAPTANQCAGIYYENANGSYATLEARDLTTGIKYSRQKITNVWGAWLSEDATYVNTAGDTMTGSLTIANNTPSLVLNKTSGAAGMINQIVGQTAGVPRWYMRLGENTETGSNVGSDFLLYNCSDAGAAISTALAISRATGNATFSGNIQAASTVTAGYASAGGSYYFGNSGTKYLNYDGVSFNLNGGPLIVNSGATIGGQLNINVPSGVFNLRLGETTGGWSKGIRVVNGGNLEFINNANTNVIMSLSDGGTLTAGATVRANGVVSAGSSIICDSGDIHSRAVAASNAIYWCDNEAGGAQGAFYWNRSANTMVMQNNTAPTSISLGPTAGVALGNGWQCRSGFSGSYGPNWSNLFYSAGPVALWIDNSNLGNITVSSDYRIKKNVIDLPSMWDTVKKLRPIKYSHQEFSPPSHLEFIAKEKQRRAEDKIATEHPPLPGPLFADNDTEQWGFLAHELQQTLTPSAATGEKDSPDTIQSPNWPTLVAALAKALQEAMARIEALEAR